MSGRQSIRSWTIVLALAAGACVTMPDSGPPLVRVERLPTPVDMRALRFFIRSVTWTLPDAEGAERDATTNRSRMYLERLTNALVVAGLEATGDGDKAALELEINVSESRDDVPNRWNVRVLRMGQVIESLEFPIEKNVVCSFETFDCTEELRRATVNTVLNRFFESRAVVLAARDSSKRRAVPAAFAPLNDRGLIAVLPLDRSGAKSMDVPTSQALDEAIRTIAGEHLSPRGFTVLTGDTTLTVLEDNGIDAAKVCDSSCALGAARELKASLFISGSVAQTEGEFVGFVRLFETSKGRQIGAIQLEGKSVRELRKSFEAKAAKLFAPLTSE